jgi:hypothetical protein
MKATKFIVLLAGVTGVVAFFLPLIAVSGAGSSVTISGFQSVQGISSVPGASSADKAAQDALSKEDLTVINKALDDSRLVILAVFAPALLCALIGLIGVAKGSFGRGLGILASVLGAIGFAIWAILNSKAGDVKGIGMWLLLASAAGATLGGLLALIKPDRQDSELSRRFAETIRR